MALCLEAFEAHLQTLPFLNKNDTILVGYSGGADSTCLLDLLHRLGWPVAAAHLHHGMRSEADEEMERCEAFCSDRNIPFVGGKADVPKLSQSLKVGLEEAGRKARYEFLQRATLRTRCKWIATAHTQDDQAETVLLNLIRGTGLNGLEGIPLRRDNIVRPLLPFTRKETRCYCAQEQLWFHDDPANCDPQFARSFVRKEIVPGMVRLNPSFYEAIDRLVDIVSEESEVLDQAAGKAMEACEIRPNGDLHFLTASVEACFALESVAALPKGLGRRAVRLVVAALGGESNFAQTDAILDGIAAQAKGSVTMEGGTVEVVWASGHIAFRRTDLCGPALYPLAFPGETTADVFGWTFGLTTEQPVWPVADEGRLVARFDADSIQGRLQIRGYEAGDRLTPLGMTQTKKVADILTDMKLTPAARALIPLVCDEAGPCWVPGGRMADRVKIKPSTRSVLRLQFGPRKSAHAETFG